MPSKPFNSPTDSNGHGGVTRPTANLAGSTVPSISNTDGIDRFGDDGLRGSGNPLQSSDPSQAKERLAERVASAQDAVEHVTTTITNRARDSAAAADEYVRASPWQAVGIGAAAGLVLGFLISRR